MVEVSLYSGHLPPSGARFPDRCVVCGNKSDTSAERPIEVGSQTGAIQALFQGTGPQQRVPVHLEGCLGRLRREYFRENAAPLLAFLGIALVTLVLSGWLFGVSAESAKLLLIAVFVASLPLTVWMTYRAERIFAIREEMDDGFRGLYTYQFRDPSLANEFRGLNEAALFKVKSASS